MTAGTFITDCKYIVCEDLHIHETEGLQPDATSSDKVKRVSIFIMPSLRRQAVEMKRRITWLVGWSVSFILADSGAKLAIKAKFLDIKRYDILLLVWGKPKSS